MYVSIIYGNIQKQGISQMLLNSLSMQMQNMLWQDIKNIKNETEEEIYVAL